MPKPAAMMKKMPATMAPGLLRRLAIPMMEATNNTGGMTNMVGVTVHGKSPTFPP